MSKSPKAKVEVSVKKGERVPRICNDFSMLELMTVPTVQDERDDIMRKKLIPKMTKTES